MASALFLHIHVIDLSFGVDGVDRVAAKVNKPQNSIGSSPLLTSLLSQNVTLPLASINKATSKETSVIFFHPLGFILGWTGIPFRYQALGSSSAPRYSRRKSSVVFLRFWSAGQHRCRGNTGKLFVVLWLFVFVFVNDPHLVVFDPNLRKGLLHFLNYRNIFFIFSFFRKIPALTWTCSVLATKMWLRSLVNRTALTTSLKLLHPRSVSHAFNLL